MKKKRLNAETIENIKALRLQGLSINEIQRKIGHAKSTILHYIQDVQISPEFAKLLIDKRGGSKKIKEEKIQKALGEARVFVSTLNQKEKILFLSALYWAEGSKKDFGLSNTDPNLIKVYVDGLRELFHVSDDRFRVSIRIYEDLNKEECLQFWAKVVRIPKEKFVSVNVLSGKKKGKLRYGMCRVRVSKGEELLKKVQAIYSIVGQYQSL